MTKHISNAQYMREYLPIARRYYKDAQRAWQKARDERIYWINFARASGLSWKEIGDLLGEQQGTVRMAARRNPPIEETRQEGGCRP